MKYKIIGLLIGGIKNNFTIEFSLLDILFDAHQTGYKPRLKYNFEGYSADTCAEIFPLVSMGG
jgi:hypothetical protein